MSRFEKVEYVNIDDLYKEFKESGFTYDCRCDWSGKITSVCYEGKTIPLSDIYYLGCDPEKNHGDYKVPEKNERFSLTNPHGCGDFNLFDSKRRLEKTLDSWKASVSPSHPLTVGAFEGYYDNYWNPINNREMCGWESIDDAEIVLVKHSFSQVPCFAIKMTDPIHLREPNERYIKARDICYNLGEAFCFLEDVFNELPEEDSEIIEKILQPMKELRKKYSEIEEFEMKKGRS